MKRILKLSTMAALIALMVFSIGKLTGYFSHSIENQHNIKELVQEKDSKAVCKYFCIAKKEPALLVPALSII
ncbi:MAG: hypothetical protein Q4D99_04330 [Bacillota bacterium]|nr:hypothetical protein [Bacillota bacterium]